MSVLNRYECLVRLAAMTDDDIDYSDIPEVTDFSNWRPAKEHLRRVAQWNYDPRAQIARSLEAQTAGQ